MGSKTRTFSVKADAKAPHLSLAVFIDALGSEIVKRFGFLPERLVVQKPLNTVFGYSSTCDPTILTGTSPQEHGHFAFFTYAPRNSPFKNIRWLQLLPGQLLNRGRVRQQISKLVKKRLGFTGYFQLYNAPFDLLPQMDFTEKLDLYMPGGIINGQKTLFDDLRESAIPFHLSDWRKGERENLDAAAKSIVVERPEFAYVFLAHLDAILHDKGSQAVEVETKLRWYEQELRTLLALAERHYEQVTFTVFSDHGMTDVVGEFSVMDVIAKLPLSLGEDYFAVYDSTMARFWFFSEFAEPTITEALQGAQNGRWLSASTLKQWGCDFPHQQYGQKFFLMNPGILLNPSFMGHKRLAGMHGYAPEDKDSMAFFGTSDASHGLPLGLQDLRSLLFRSVCKESLLKESA